MTNLLIRTIDGDPPRTVYAADTPIDFETWLELTPDLDTDLIQGVMVPRMAAQYPHEWIFAWLLALLRTYTRHLGLGVVLGSRTAVKINTLQGRLPDILFVRADNTDIIRHDAIYGVPDLVIEIISPNDRPGDLLQLEEDYRALGVPKIVFIDPQCQRVRVASQTETGYSDTIYTTGPLTFTSVTGFQIQVEWLFADAQPDELTTILQIVHAARNGQNAG